MNISKKTAIILILGIVFLLIGLFLYFYLTPEKTNLPNRNNSEIEFGDTSKENTPGEESGVTEEERGTETEEIDGPTNTLRQIFSEPTAGANIFTRNKEVFVRFVERSNGNIYETKRDSAQTIRLTNKTIPKIQETIWDKNPDSLVLRYLNDDREDQIESFSGKIKVSTSTTNEFLGDITGLFLPPNIKTISGSSLGGKIVYLQNKLNSDNSYIFTSNFDGSNKTQVAEIPLSEISLSWPKSNTIAVLTKPSFRYPGFLYFINPNEGILRKVIGGPLGLNTLVNAQANGILYSRTNNKSEPMLNYFDLNNNNNINLEIKTLSDKCIWGKKDPSSVFCAVPKTIPTKELPDAWYQGKISFNDNFWKIELETGKSSLIYDTSIGGENLDATDLQISDSDDFLVFTNKKDLTLWGLKIE